MSHTIEKSWGYMKIVFAKICFPAVWATNLALLAICGRYNVECTGYTQVYPFGGVLEEM